MTGSARQPDSQTVDLRAILAHRRVTVADLVERDTGSRVWVMAARLTPRLRAKYGDTAVALSERRYAQYAREAEILNVEHHAVYPLIVKLLGTECDAGNLLRAMIEAGFRVEPEYRQPEAE